MRVAAYSSTFDWSLLRLMAPHHCYCNPHTQNAQAHTHAHTHTHTHTHTHIAHSVLLYCTCIARSELLNLYVTLYVIQSRCTYINIYIYIFLVWQELVGLNYLQRECTRNLGKISSLPAPISDHEEEVAIEREWKLMRQRET